MSPVDENKVMYKAVVNKHNQDMLMRSRLRHDKVTL